MIRFNKEYFGFVVGFPDGKILLTSHEAEEALLAGASYDEIAGYRLESVDVHDNFFLHTPPLVWLEITKKCNLKCPHCYIDGGEMRDNEMSSEQIHAVIDEMGDMGVWAIAITGGEPTLHPDFVSFVKHARDRNILVGVATHGLHLTDKLLESLPKEGVIISISLDDLHIHSKKDFAEFNLVRDALLRCQAHGFNANIMTNTNRKNISQLEGVISWAEQHGVSVRSVPFSPIGDRAKRNAAELENIPEDAYEAAKFWLKEVLWEHQYHEKVGLCVGVIFNYGLTMAYMTNRCSSARYLGYIASDGTLYPCTMCAGEKIFPAGNVARSGFRNLWLGDWEIRKMNWSNFEETCTGCPLHNDMFYCSSRCPAMSYARHGDFTSCGASDFEKLSLIIRTSLMESSPLKEVREDHSNYTGPQVI